MYKINLIIKVILHCFYSGDMGMKRSIEDLEEIETHHRAKRTL